MEKHSPLLDFSSFCLIFKRVEWWVRAEGRGFDLKSDKGAINVPIYSEIFIPSTSSI